VKLVNAIATRIPGSRPAASNTISRTSSPTRDQRTPLARRTVESFEGSFRLGSNSSITLLRSSVENDEAGALSRDERTGAAPAAAFFTLTGALRFPFCFFDLFAPGESATDLYVSE
jgi:hypothetical protein